MGLYLSGSASVLDAEDQPRQISFIYVHGAKQYTSAKKEKFEKQVSEIHEELLKRVDKSEIIQEQVLKTGEYELAPSPITYYWGDQYQESVSILKRQLSAFKDYYRNFTGFFRKQLVFPLHDLIWLSRFQNQNHIVDGLFKKVKQETKQNKEVVLLGHSAGSVVVYDFVIYRVSIINLYEILKGYPEIEKNTRELFKDRPYTCAQALLDSGLGKINEHGEMVGIFKGIVSESGKEDVLQRIQHNYFNERLPLLFNFNEQSCIDQEEFAGMVTFGSPLVVSKSFSGNDLESKQTTRLVDFLVRDGAFWLHINHMKDFIGLPINADKILSEKRLQYQSEGYEADRLGFVANNPKKKWGATFIGGHGWYFNSPKSFAKLLVKTYEEGYTNINNKP